MTATLEIARGIGVLSRLFGTAPLVAFRASRPGIGRATARAIVLKHTASVRRAASVRLEIAATPERADGSGGFVLAYNQTSIADDLGNLDVLWQFADHSVLAAEYGLIPYFKAAAERIGIVLMRRGDRVATEQAIAHLVGRAAAGDVVTFAAEGRLSPDGVVGHFKRGAFLVAIRAGVPVVPMAVHGGRAILRPGSLRLRPGMLRYRFGPPISVAGLVEDDAPKLAEHTREVVAALFAEAESEARLAN